MRALKTKPTNYLLLSHLGCSWVGLDKFRPEVLSDPIKFYYGLSGNSCLTIVVLTS